jgi:phosphatidylserine/phosphatidylglycerophosphate/cardiolipin synthase-like enzyme
MYRFLWGMLVLGLSLGACQHRQTLSITQLPTQLSVSTPRPAALSQDPAIEVFFNQSQSHQYTDPYRHIQRDGDDLEALVVDTITRARRSVAVAVQEIRLPRVAQALIDKHRAGVKVQVIVENTYNNTVTELEDALSSTPEDEEDRAASKVKDLMALVDRNRDGQASPEELLQGDAIYMLRAAKIPLIDDRAGGKGLMHHKFIIVDDRILITGSANLTPSDVHGDLLAPNTRGNANHLLKVTSPALAQLYRQEFNILWGNDGKRGNRVGGTFGTRKPKRLPQTVKVGNTEVIVNFSPRSRRDPFSETTNGLIAKTLSTVRQEADLALFVFSEQRLANALLTPHQRGAAVKVLIDPGFAFRNFSEGLDLLGVALPNRQCRPETRNRPWNPPLTSVGVPDLIRGDKLHHKFAVLDHATIITGSHNWSAAANYTNDENLLIFTNPTIAAHFQREFDRLYRSASLGLPPKIQEEINLSQQRCQP